MAPRVPVRLYLAYGGSTSRRPKVMVRELCPGDTPSPDELADGALVSVRAEWFGSGGVFLWVYGYDVEAAVVEWERLIQLVMLIDLPRKVVRLVPTRPDTVPWRAHEMRRRETDHETQSQGAQGAGRPDALGDQAQGTDGEV